MNRVCFKNLRMHQVQRVLNKNTFLSKQSTPGSVDGLIFQLINQSKFPLKRIDYPHIYYWFILMKQFALSTINKWITQFNDSYQNEFVNEFFFNCQLSFHKQTCIASNHSCFQSQNFRPFVIFMKIHPTKMNIVKNKLLTNFRCSLQSVEQLSNQEIKVSFISEGKDQLIKQQLLKWDQTIQIQIKKVKRIGSKQVEQII